MADIAELEARLRALEDRQAISDLVTRYGMVVDDHDLEGVTNLFAPDGVLRTHAGLVKGAGRDAVREYFLKKLFTLGPTNHFVHGLLVDFDEYDPDRATGVAFSHAEVWRDEKPMLTAMRYIDEYVRVDETWLFRDRVQSYMYFADVRDYAEVLGAELRVRTPPAPDAPGDWPVWFNERFRLAAED